LVGFRIKLFVRRVMSNVLRDEEELITTATRRS
jgi:hypothetical protein